MKTYIEDIFIEFYDQCVPGLIMTTADQQAAADFAKILKRGDQITRSQSFYIIRLLKTNAAALNILNPAYTTVVRDNPQWRMQFRVLDDSCIASVNGIYLYLKFPYHIRDRLLEACSTSNASSRFFRYDSTKQEYYTEINATNFFSLHSILVDFRFKFSDSYEQILGQYEDIWDNYEAYTHYSMVINDAVHIINGNKSADEWWDTHKTGNIDSDLMLAKSMGFPYNGNANTVFEKIAASPTNFFWVRDILNFLNIAMTSSGKTCIILDRASDTLPWIINFINTAIQANYDTTQIKVCTRFSNITAEQKEFFKKHKLSQDWNLGKIIIFVHRPNKWITDILNEVSILATNQMYPNININNLSKLWMASHPCVCFIDPIAPISNKDLNIVNL